MPGANIRRVGFEGKLYWGAVGSTAATELVIAKDVNYSFDPQNADTSDRESIVDYERVAKIKFSLDFEASNKDSDTFIAAVRAAASTGAPLAFRTRDKTSGYGCDGDFNIKLDESQPLRDSQKLKVTATPTNEYRNLSWS